MNKTIHAIHFMESDRFTLSEKRSMIKSNDIDIIKLIKLWVVGKVAVYIIKEINEALL